MPSVVKSPMVVDDRIGSDIAADAGFVGARIIKRNFSNYRSNPYARENCTLPDKKGYHDEINRLKAEISLQKAELRRMNRLVEEARAQESPVSAEASAEAVPAGEVARELLEAAHAEAEQVLAEAREQAAAITQAAQAAAEELREQTLSVGYLEGFEKGTLEAQEEFRRENAPGISELNALLERLSAYYEDQVAKNERSLLELVFTVAQKILGQEIKAEPRAVVPILYETLDRNRREEDIRITVSPELLPAGGKATEEIRKLIAKAAPHATITIDRELAPGSVIVETPKGIMDISPETQLQNLREVMLEG